MKVEIFIAIIGFLGVIVGALIQIIGNIILNYFLNHSKIITDRKRKKVLKHMLKTENYNWRKLETLMHVIGADEETTKRLLLEIGARGSEDGQEMWGLIKRNPFK